MDDKMIKKMALLLLLAATAVAICNAGGKSEQGAKGGAEAAAQVSGKNADPDTSYAFGMYLGAQFHEGGLQLDLNYDEFMKGFKDSFEGKDTRITMDEAESLIQTASAEIMTRRAEENRQQEAAFLEGNGRKSGVITTASGLQYEVLVQGTGAKPSVADTVEVHYEGTFLDGTLFDSSYVRGEPAQMALDQIIPGWAEGIPLMSAGSTYRFFIPSKLAYGERGAGGAIPPNSMLIFKVELLSIVKK
jgi:FKBP-type peptidyl-prolyl cis-trans isomerase